MTPVDIKKTDGNQLSILWQDGHESFYSMAMLRKKCPCATCKNTRENAASGSLRVLASQEIVPDDILVTQADIVGRYAVQFTWSDSHHEGIYSFDYLLELCQCDKCNDVVSD